MKVELEKIVLGHSSLTDRIHAGVLNKKGNMFLQKKDVSNLFIDCVIRRWEGQKETISAGDKKWEISVKNTTEKPNVRGTKYEGQVSSDAEIVRLQNLGIKMANEIERKRQKIRLLKKALTRIVAEFDTTTPVPNQKEAVRYANNLLQSNDE